MTHDPLCPVKSERVGGAATDPSVTAVAYQPNVPCQCDLIVKVEDRTQDLARQAVARTCGHTKYVGCVPCAHDDAVHAIDELFHEERVTGTDTLRTSCHRGCRDGLVRVLSFDGEEAEVDVCPCSR